MADTSDLELARRAAAGDAHAIAEIERCFRGDVDRALARLRIDAALGDEIRQRVREKLFVARGGRPPAIASYEGRGPLAAFLRAVVVHTAVGLRRAERDHDGESQIDRAAADDDVELAAIRRRYGPAFKEAFQGAMASLTPRDRNVLRLVYVDGLAVEEVALAYGVHRVSVSRWLGETRKLLHLRTRAALAARLDLGPAELASVARLCLSQIDLSLDRVLRGA
jgi:RNA polymerase sigma-70 factor, ECF subfamily